MVGETHFRLLSRGTSDLELVALGEANPGWRIERSADGDLILSPTSSSSGFKSAEALRQLFAFRAIACGHVADSSTGFTMPDGSVLSPDAAWISDATYGALDRTTTFWHVVPDIVVEIASPSDRWSAVVAKVDRYVRFGATYAMAIDPRTRAVHPVGVPPNGFTFDAEAVIDA